MNQAATPSRAIIELKDVQKYYGSYHALRGINTEIRQGEFFSLLGPSGCGKTTLLRTIAGFEELSSGVLKIDGKDMDGVPANVRPTNMVFQPPRRTLVPSSAPGAPRPPSARPNRPNAKPFRGKPKGPR